MLIPGLIVLISIAFVNFYQRSEFSGYQDYRNVDKLTRIQTLTKDTSDFERLHRKYLIALGNLKNQLKASGDRYIKDSQSKETLARLGDIYTASDLIDIGIRYYDAALSVWDLDKVLHLKKGLALGQMGNLKPSEFEKYWGEAEKEYLTAVGIDPRYEKGLYALTNLQLAWYQKKGNKDKLAEAFENSKILLREYPSVSDNVLLQAKILNEQGENQKALMAYQRVLTLSPKGTPNYELAYQSIKILGDKLGNY